MATWSNLLYPALLFYIVCFEISLCVDNDCYGEEKVTCHTLSSIDDIKLSPGSKPKSLFIIGKPSSPLNIRNLRRRQFTAQVDFTQLTELTMTYAGVEDIAQDAFQDLKQLKRLELKFNKIGIISQSTFTGLVNLENIDLTGNEGCILEPKAVANLPNLRNLYLADLKIRSLYVNSFEGLHSLLHLDLSGNNIRSINKDILSPLTNLESLDITGNHLKGLDQSMKGTLQKLKSVSLGNNPWQCNCDMKWFKDLPMTFIYDTTAFSADRVVVCSGPEKFRFMNFKDIPDKQLICKPPKIKDCLAVTEQQGYDAKIVCNISGDPFPDIKWTLPDKSVINSRIEPSATKYEILDNGVLLIKSLNFSQSGTWRIQAKNVKGDDEETVAIKVLPPDVAPTITGCRDVTEQEGNKAVIECTIGGNPFPNITWTLPDKTSIESFIGPDVSKYDILTNGSLVIKDLETLHNGQWDISVMNKLGKNKAEVHIKVLPHGVAPTVKECHDIVEQEGKQALIECTIQGDPFPNITWTLPDTSSIQSEVAFDKSKYEIKSTGVLLIKSLALSDDGVWRLTVQNKFGHDSSSVNIKIKKVVETSTKKPDSNNMGIIIGAGAGGGVALISLIIVIAVCCKNKKNAVDGISKD